MWRSFSPVQVVTGCGEVSVQRPVAQATVTFIGVDGKRVAAGLTDANGKYTLTTFQKGDGAVPGEYRVKVEKFERAAGPSSTSASETKGPAEDKNYVPPPEMAPGATAPLPKNLLPAKYADPNTLGLTATVKEGPNEFNFTVD